MRLRECSLRWLSGGLPLLAAAGVSFGAAAGKPNLSGNLTKVTQPTKNQKLLADPDGAIEGSNSILYDPTVATLTQVLAEPEANPISSRQGNGYYIDEIVVNGFNQQGQVDNKIISLAGTSGLSWTNTSQLPFRQSGLVQVFWADLAPGTDPIGYSDALPSQQNNPNYYNPLPNLKDGNSESGTYHDAIADIPNTAVGGNAAGDNNTYAAFFGPVSSNPNAFAQYMVYADTGTNFAIPDEYTALSNGSTITYTAAGGIGPAIVGASFAPEPSSIAMIGIGSAMMLRRRRASAG